jgi:predicted transcriptional regulator
LPKLKENEIEVLNNRTRGIIFYIKGKLGINTKALSKRIGLSPYTLYKKLENPEQLTLKDIRLLKKEGSLTNDQLIELVGF